LTLKVRVATRGSRLSLIQVEIALGELRKHVKLDYELVIVKTKGDLVQDKPLHMIGGKGLFEKEVNKAVLRGDADIAVHSAKDLPSAIDPRLEIVYVPPRGTPNDALVARNGRPLDHIAKLPPGSVVGTSSVRRRALILHYNPSLRVETLRGNVDTRVRKLMSGLYDYAVMAAVGLERLGLKVPYKLLPLDEFPPAPGQGIIAVVAPHDSPLAKILRSYSDRTTMLMLEAERSFLEYANAGCHVPLGGVSVPTGTGQLTFIAALLSPDGSRGVWIKMKDSIEKARELGRRVGETVSSLYDRILG
jgi:hydroxymethylbilane synthase